MRTDQRLLLDVVRSQLIGTEISIPEALDVQSFLALCQEHRLEPFAFLALQNCSDFPKEALRSLEAAYDRAIFRDTQFDFLKASITQALTEQGVDHVFLKGICLKQDYPVSALRTMSDLDLLVHGKDLPAIRRIMEKLGGSLQESDGNHRSFLFSDLQVCVEFHPMLIHVSSPVATKVNPGWQYVPQGQPAGQKQLSPEGFYLSILAHLASHFVTGGVGIRFILDVWVCRHLRKQQPDRKKLEQELERIGLLEFARKIEALSEHWFSGVPADLEELADYVMTSGSHGNQERAMLNAVCLAGSRTSALRKKIFYPKADLENRFDWAIGRPWLLPAAWITRCFYAVTRRSNLIRQWQAGTQTPTEEQAAQQRAKLERFGIKSMLNNNEEQSYGTRKRA